MKTLRLILGDQLNHNHSWLQEVNDDVTYCLFEMRQETDYVQHHIQKVVGFFSAMRSFSDELIAKNHQVIYYQINDERNQQDLVKNLHQIIENNSIERFEYLYPDEYRLDKQLKEFCDELSIENEVLDSEHFYTSRTELKVFFEGKKQYLMENFYRSNRKNYEILMELDGKTPLTGKWNYDASNRKKLPKKIKLLNLLKLILII